MEEFKIKKLKINHFRGITQELEIPFSNGNQCCSYLFFGENGSGKSSIIDAIEANTNNKFDRTRKKSITESISYDTQNDKAVIELQFNNDTKNIITIKKRYSDSGKIETLIKGKEVPNFQYAPYVLRRADILSFWNLKDSEKLKVFIDLRAVRKNAKKLDEEYKQRLDKEKQNHKQLIKQLLKNFNRINADDVTTLNRFYSLYISQYGDKFHSLTQKHDKKTYDLVSKIQGSESRIKTIKANKKRESIDYIPEGKYEPLQKRLIRVSEKVTSAFINLSNSCEAVKEIKIEVGDEGELSIKLSVILQNGVIVKPEFFFSEANRDLLSLLIYLEFTFDSTSLGQAKILVLDDVFQSVDSSIRYKIMIYILDTFKDWQFIITTHDRLWKEQLQLLFRNRGITLQISDIKRWDFNNGPILIDSRNIYEERLQDIVRKGSSVEICAGAGYLLEVICEQLSFSLATSIERRYGDKYTIGDLWPGIYKRCKKTQEAEVFNYLNDLIGLRNIVGCHYNEWAVNVSMRDACDFANAVLNVYEIVFDKDKNKWIQSIDEINIYHANKIALSQTTEIENKMETKND